MIPKKPTDTNRNFIFEEVIENPNNFKLTDQGSGIALLFQKKDNKTIKEMSRQEIYCVCEQFSKIITQQLAFEKQIFIE